MVPNYIYFNFVLAFLKCIQNNVNEKAMIAKE